jgi:hypothetical protein
MRVNQRVLNGLQRIRHSCGRFRLLAHPLAPLSRQKVVSLTQSSCVSLFELLTGEGGGGGRGANLYDGEKILALSKSFHTLWGIVWPV